MTSDPANTGYRVAQGKSGAVGTIAVEDLANEAVSWGMSKRRATAVVTSCTSNVHDVIDTVDLPPGAEAVRTNLEDMWVRRAWSVSDAV